MLASYFIKIRELHFFSRQVNLNSLDDNITDWYNITWQSNTLIIKDNTDGQRTLISISTLYVHTPRILSPGPARNR